MRTYSARPLPPPARHGEPGPAARPSGRRRGFRPGRLTRAAALDKAVHHDGTRFSTKADFISCDVGSGSLADVDPPTANGPL